MLQVKHSNKKIELRGFCSNTLKCFETAELVYEIDFKSIFEGPLFRY